MRRRSLRALLRDRKGAVGPMIAALGVSLLAAAGLALDVGLYQLGNRDLRAATEAAALAAAMNPAQANTRARDYLTRNGYDPAVLQSVTLGRYCADSGLTGDQRFDASFARCPGNGTANAVRIRTRMVSRRFLTSVLGDVVVPDLASTATAARIDEAGIGVTSGTLDISTPLVGNVVDGLEGPVNLLLGALLNTAPLDLQSASIEAMMKHDVDAGLFFDNLAKRQGFTGTYAELTSRQASLADILNAAADATTDPASAAGLRRVAGNAAAGAKIDLTGMFGLGVWKNMPVGEADAAPALRAGINAYQLLAFSAQRVGGAIDLSRLTRTITGTNALVRIGAIVTDPRARPSFSFGPSGETSVSTAAVRLQVQVGLPDVVLLGQRVTANVPLLLEISPSQASVSEIACASTAEQAQNTEVRVRAQSGLASAFIGKVTPAVMSRPFGTALPLANETLLGLDVNLVLTTIKVGIVGSATLPNLVQAQSNDLVFGPNGPGRIGRPGTPGHPPIAATPVSIDNRSQIGPSVQTLLNNLNLGIDASLLGLNINLNLSLLKSQLVTALLTPVTNLLGGTVDPLLDNVLAALGIKLGHASVWVTGARCGVPVIV